MQLIKSDVKLSVGILVSNNIKYIRKAMEAIKPLLDAVPSELIALDTVGELTDGSIAVVKEYTDKIYPFVWCNDFAAARNACLKHASGEWFMFQDDDEVFDDVTELIHFFQRRECDNYYTGYYHVKNYLPNGEYAMAIVGRLIRRTTETCFVGKVHEHFKEEFAPKKQFACFVHHYGYLYETADASAKKQKRNMELLNAEIREHGLTPQRAAQMAQELLSRPETAEEGYLCCMDYIKELDARKELDNCCSQWLLTASVRAFWGKNAKLLEQAEHIRKNYPLTQMAELILAVSAALAAAAENNRELVAEYTELYFKSRDWWAMHEEEALQQTTLDFPVFYEEKYYQQMTHLAAQAANQAGRFRLAAAYWKRLPWQREGFDKTPYIRDFTYTMECLNYEKKLAEINSFLNILSEAGNAVETAILQDQTALQELLVGMQETAIAAGTRMDALLGEGSKAVSLLEEYCELVWQCSNEKTLEGKLRKADSMKELIKKIKNEFS